MLISNITEAHYLITDSSNVRFQVYAYVEDGLLPITLRTKLEDGVRSTELQGAEQFRHILRHFASRFRAIRGNWVYGDNLKAFNTGVAEGLSWEQAALQTWTGRQALAAGYDRVEVLEWHGLPGSFKQVKVNFWPHLGSRIYET